MSGNIWAVLNNVSEDSDGKIKVKKPAKKSGTQAKKTNQPAGGGNKPQLTDKAARAFRDGQKPKQAKPQPQQQKKVPVAKPPAPAVVKPAATSSSSAGKSAVPAKQQGPAIVVKPAAAPAPAPAQTAVALPQGVVHQKTQNFVKALNQVLNGQTAFFQVSLMRSSEVGVLQSNPYRVVGDMVKSPQFITNLGLALKKDAKEFAKKDARAKILGRVNRVGLAHHLLALLSGHSPVHRSKTDEEATRLVTGFLEAVWNLPPPAEPVKRVEVTREEVGDEEDEMIGSAGSVKRDAVTLSDFITVKPAKVKGGKKGKPQQPAQQTGKGKEKVNAAPAPASASAAPVVATQPAAAAPAPAAAAAVSPKAEAQAAPVVPEGKKDDPTSWRTDLVDGAKQLSKRIPGSIQCVRVEPSFLWSAEEVKASGKQQQHYFKGEGCDHCYAFWEDGKGDIYFLITNGSA